MIDTSPIETCPFCALIAARDSKLVEEVPGLDIFHFEPLNPVVEGHRLFVSREHFSRPELNVAVTGLLFGSASRYAGRQGGDYNLIVNAGPDASQTVWHVHVHYVPRSAGDGLKLPWTEQHRG